MRYVLIACAPRPVLVVRPREATYGHQALEILMGLHMAAARQYRVLYRRPRRVANRALFEIECAEVEVLAPGRAPAIQARAWLREVGEGIRRAAGTLRERGARVALQVLSRMAKRHPAVRSLRQRYKRGLDGAFRARQGPPDFFGLDFRECYARRPLRITLRERLRARAEAAARELGLGPSARIVTLHVRESGFKKAQGGESEVDASRNARIETYLPAVDLLVSRGYRVVRIGDRTMTPVAWAGLVDLATSRQRTDALELWLMMRSELFIGCDSGPYCATFLTNTPCLAVNVTNIIGGYPVHAYDRYILKRVYDRQRGCILTLREMLTLEYFETRTNLDRYRVLDNSPDEIREAVEEMVTVVHGGPAARSPAQQQFHELAEGLQSSDAVAARRTRKGEPARQLLGEGAICRVFVERYLNEAETAC